MSRRHGFRHGRDILSRSPVHGVTEGISAQPSPASLSKVGQDVLKHVHGGSDWLVVPNGKPAGHRMLAKPSMHAGNCELRLLVDRGVRFCGRKPRGGFVLQTLGRLSESALCSVDPGPPKLERRFPVRAAKEQPLVVGTREVGTANRIFDPPLEQVGGRPAQVWVRLGPPQDAELSSLPPSDLRCATDLVALEPQVSGTYRCYRHDRDPGHAHR